MLGVQSRSSLSDKFAFLSAREEVNRLDLGGSYVHSLSYVSQRFEQLFKFVGAGCSIVADPAAYTLPFSANYLMERSDNGLDTASSRESIHLSIREWQDIKLMPAADRNIAHFSWEGSTFPTESQRGFGTSPTETLRAFDEVWCISEFLETALRDRGFSQVSTVPVPIATRDAMSSFRTSQAHLGLISELLHVGSEVFCPYLHHDPTFTRIDEWREVHSRLDARPLARLVSLLGERSIDSTSTLFVTQGNPGDSRKNLILAMEGFGLFAAEHPDAYLIVLAPPASMEETTLRLRPASVDRFGWGWWGSRNIFIVPAHLTDESQAALYGLADFFLNTSLAEGQHIPLQESIQAGCLPISSVHTAIQEYLDVADAVVISSDARDELMRDDRTGREFRRTHHYVDPLDVAEACERATLLPQVDRDQRVIRLSAALDRYTLPLVAEQVTALLGWRRPS